MLPVAAVIGLTLARSYGVRQFATKSIAYNITHWAYSKVNDRRSIAPPREHVRLIQQNVPNDLRDYVDAWDEAGRQAKQKLNEFCVREKVQRESVQVMYRFLGKGRDFVTARVLMEKICQQHFSRNLDKVSFMTPAPAYPIQ